MLELEIYKPEVYDEETNEFSLPFAGLLKLEHSLRSVSKWESKWEIPFLGDKPRTDEQTLDYIRCMSIDEFDEDLVQYFTRENFQEITNYINAKMTATWFAEKKNQPASREVITSEVMYYWMVALQIDFQCQDWHLNRFLTLVKVANEKNQPEKKMSKSELAARNRELNAKRREQMKSRG